MTTDNRNCDRILVIDDNRAIHGDFRKILCDYPVGQAALEEKEAVLFGEKPRAERLRRLDIQSAYQGQEGLTLVQKAVQENLPFAMAFVDVRMPPGWDGIETAVKLWEAAPDLQVVICTAYADYAWEDMSERLGRSDRWVILKKPFDPVEVLQLVDALTEKVRLMHQARAREEELERRVQERTAALAAANDALLLTKYIVDGMGEAVFWIGNDASCIYVNEAAGRLVGYSRAELLAMTVYDLDPTFSRNEWPATWKEFKKRKSLVFERNLRAKDGRAVPVEFAISYLEYVGKEYGCAFVHDITERKQAEERRKQLETRLHQQHKMAAIGTLAGGMSHDFNNILASVRGYAELLQERFGRDTAARADLDVILREVDRAVDLTGQLLSFSQHQMLRPVVTGLHPLIGKMEAPLREILGERIELKVDLAADSGLVKVDQSQIMKILAELAENVSEVMPQGGRVTIRCANVTVSENEAAAWPDARTGEFVRLSFNDTGPGMTPEIMQRLFEPFFSTKHLGAGLGLPSVYGLVRQHEGWIVVSSTIGVGTTFNIYLPRVAQVSEERAPVAASSAPKHKDIRGHAERILLVEDEKSICNLVRRTLQAEGYQVFAVGSCVEAMTLFAQEQGRVDLLFSDIILPDRNGIDLAIELQSRQPGLKVLLTSGYTDEQTRWPALQQHNFRFISKPFLLADLFQAVHDVLLQTRVPITGTA